MLISGASEPGEGLHSQPFKLTWQAHVHVEVTLFSSIDSINWGGPAYMLGFPGGVSGKEPTCHCRRHKQCRCSPWVGKVPWRRAQQPTPVFLPGESLGQRNLAGYTSIGSCRVRHDWSDLVQHSISVRCQNHIPKLCQGATWKKQL